MSERSYELDLIRQGEIVSLMRTYMLANGYFCVQQIISVTMDI
jgi:hypothetical protein